MYIHTSLTTVLPSLCATKMMGNYHTHSAHISAIETVGTSYRFIVHVPFQSSLGTLYYAARYVFAFLLPPSCEHFSEKVPNYCPLDLKIDRNSPCFLLDPL